MPRTFIAGLLLAATLWWAPLLPAAETAAGRSSTAAADPVSARFALAEAKAAAGEPLQALVIIQQALAAAGDSRADELLARAHGLLQNRLDDSQLAEAAFMFRGSALGQDALLQQAVRAAARGERVVALRLAENLVQGGLPFPYRPEAVRLWEQLSGQSWLPRAVGVRLPLSGRFATFGELVRRGMDLALEMHQEGGKTPVRLLYRDTGADAAQSVQAVIELAEGERVLAIIGPLTGSDAQAAASQAQQLAIPLLALAQKEGLPETRRVQARI
jgi:outer membrane PBP1 activator LpoA protein